MSDKDKKQDKDQKQVDKMSRFQYMLELVNIQRASLQNLFRQDLLEVKKSIIGTLDKDAVRAWLERPDIYQSQLRALSDELYRKSSHYKNLVNYFANMAMFVPVIYPFGDIRDKNTDQIKKGYYTALGIIEKLNLQSYLKTIMITLFKEDSFFGYLHESKNGAYIQRLHGDYCRISSIVDGVYSIKFDLSFFDSDPSLLDAYADEFKVAYARYAKSKDPNARWFEIDDKKTIAFKLNEEELAYSYPPLAGVFGEIFDLEVYKASRRFDDRIGKYNFIYQTLPVKFDATTTNELPIDYNFFELFHEVASQQVSNEIGIITSIFEPKVIQFKDNRIDQDLVAKAERDFYGAAGISQFLFNSDKATNASVTRSMEVDQAVIFPIYRQIERWLNKKLQNDMKQLNFFRVKLLDVTRYNFKDMFDIYLKSAQSGLPVKTMLGSLVGASGFIDNMTMLENDVLQLHENFIPLATSHTMSNSDAGRPQMSDTELSDEGARTREREVNQE